MQSAEQGKDASGGLSHTNQQWSWLLIDKNLAPVLGILDSLSGETTLFAALDYYGKCILSVFSVQKISVLKVVVQEMYSHCVEITYAALQQIFPVLAVTARFFRHPCYGKNSGEGVRIFHFP